MKQVSTLFLLALFATSASDTMAHTCPSIAGTLAGPLQAVKAIPAGTILDLNLSVTEA
ncbi:hypothetical protein [Dokdonella sp.]|uniref:hypothetical protein n=1 Tax=Dokdonella sp. TaxID=2291710 RepID=UPI003C6FA3A8